MEAKMSFGDAIVSQELNKEAWRQLSREFKWNEELLRRYRGEIDWEALSCNNEMLWTASILENFKNYIDWKALSGIAPERLLTPKIIEKFADKWDWGRIINRWRGEELYTPDFLERYKEFIPAEHFMGSNLWDALVERRFDELVEEIMG